MEDMSEAQLEAFSRMVWQKREHLAYQYIQCDRVMVGGKIRALIAARGHRRPDDPTHPPGTLTIMGINILPNDTLRPDEWQLRDAAGQVHAFGLLSDLEGP
jgi:hypothetical protein